MHMSNEAKTESQRPEPRTELRKNKAGRAVDLIWRFLDEAEEGGVLGQVVSLLRGLPGPDLPESEQMSTGMKRQTVGRIRRVLFGPRYRGVTYPSGTGHEPRAWFGHRTAAGMVQFEGGGVRGAWERAPTHYRSRYLQALTVCEDAFKPVGEGAEPKPLNATMEALAMETLRELEDKARGVRARIEAARRAAGQEPKPPSKLELSALEARLGDEKAKSDADRRMFSRGISMLQRDLGVLRTELRGRTVGLEGQVAELRKRVGQCSVLRKR